MSAARPPPAQPTSRCQPGSWRAVRHPRSRRLVTGGGSGIGAAIAKGLAQAGARLVILDIDEAGAEATAATIVSQGGNATAFRCDVTNREAVEEAAGRDRRRARAGRHPRQQRGDGVPQPSGRVPRGATRCDPGPEHQGHLPALPVVRSEDAGSPERQHHQSRLDRWIRGLPPCQRVRDEQGRGGSADPSVCDRVDRPRCAGKRDRSVPRRLTPVRPARDAIFDDERLHRRQDAPRRVAAAARPDRRRALPRKRRLRRVTGHTIAVDDGYLAA